MKIGENEAETLAQAKAALDAATRAVAAAQQTIDDRRREAAEVDRAIAAGVDRGDGVDKIVEFWPARRAALAGADLATRDLTRAQNAHQLAERKHKKAAALAARIEVGRRAQAAADRFAAKYEPLAEGIVALMASDRLLVAKATAAFARWGKAAWFGAAAPALRGWLAAPAFHQALRLPCVNRSGNFWYPSWKVERLDKVKLDALVPFASLDLDGPAPADLDALNRQLATTEAQLFDRYEFMAKGIVAALAEMQPLHREVDQCNAALRKVVGHAYHGLRAPTPSMIIREDTENLAGAISLPALGSRGKDVWRANWNSDALLEMAVETA